MTYRILVTNDDGVAAPGLSVAEQIAKEIAGEMGTVVTVAPAVDNSGVGHSISYLRPSMILKHSETKYSVEGTPADCILAGIYYVMKDMKPDLILSGVNNGHNVAEDILYSGTAGAAMEGALQGIKSIAMSQCYSKEFLTGDIFQAARDLGKNICSKLLETQNWSANPYQTFYNINFPAIKTSAVKGVSICKQGKRPNGSFSMESIDSPNGKTFLMVNHKPKILKSTTAEEIKNDAEEIKNNFVTITALNADLTNYGEMDNLRKAFQNAF